MESWKKVGITLVVLGSLYFLASLVLWGLSRSHCRRERDPARWVFTCLKVTYLFWIVFLGLYIIGYVLPIPSGHWAGAVFCSELTAEHITHIVIFLTFVHLGLGILLARTGQQVRLHNIVTCAAFGLFTVLLVLAIAYFGISMKFPVAYRLGAVLIIFEFTLSVVMLGFGIFVLVKVRAKHPKLKTPATYFLVCTVLWFIRNLFEMIGLGVFFGFYRYNVPLFRFFLSITPTFILLVMLFVLGKKKIGGLWSVSDTQALGLPATDGGD